MLRGTIRTLSEAVRARVGARVRELVQGIAAACGATAEVELLPGYPVLVNDADIVRRVLDVAVRVGFDAGHVTMLDPQGGAEDFAYYAQHVPAAFVFLGARSDEPGCSYPHHHPRFQIDERALPWGAALLAQYALGTSRG